MKVSVDIDCTPEEARRFLGLPDLAPVHEAYVETMRKAMSDGIAPEAVADAIRKWGPMSENMSAMWKTMFDQMGFDQMGFDQMGRDKPGGAKK
ncbi:MAG: hypothetical protein JWN69_1945 [Alphaproteobacteria bacterium]|nr:hypothetical protein [Alphaproteobacteria bacterium]